MSTVEAIDIMLASMPFYGEFKIDDLLVSNKMLKDEDGRPHATKTVDGSAKDKIYQYLVSNGYAMKRNDVLPSGDYLQLTERGRWLKERGSMESYREYQAQKKQTKALESERVRQLEKAQIYMMRLTAVLAVGTSVAAIYYGIEILKYFCVIHR